MARSSKFDFSLFLRVIRSRPIVETLYDMWLRLGGSTSTTATLITINAAATAAAANNQVTETESVNTATFKATIKRLEKRITQLESQIDR